MLSWLVVLVLIALTIAVFAVGEFYQSFLTFPLVAGAAFLSLSWCLPLARTANGQMDWFHPSVLFCAFALTYVMFPGVWIWLYHGYESSMVYLGTNPRGILNSVFCLGGLSAAAYGLGARVFLASGTRVRTGQLNPAGLGSLAKGEGAKFLMVLAVSYIVVGLIFKLYLLSKFGALSGETLRYLSPGRRAELESNVSLAVQMMGNLLDWGALLVFLLALARWKVSGRRCEIWLAIAVLLFVATIDFATSGKRSAVIFLGLFPMIWYHYSVKRFSAMTALVGLIVSVAAVLGLLVARIAVPLVAEGLTPSDYIGSDAVEAIPFFLDSGEFGTIDMIEVSLARKAELLHEIGGGVAGFMEYTFGTLQAFVPRIVWPTKPNYEDLSQIYRLVVFGDAEGGIAPTIWGTWYLFFGPVGLGVLMFVMGYLFEAIYRRVNPWSGSPAKVVLYSMFLWLAFQAMRFGTLGFVLILVIQTMMAGFVAVWFLSLRKEGDAACG